jgi:isoleucyl-tRNA synthetase
MLRRTGTLARECCEWYANFEFHRVYHALHDFCTVDLSAFYFDVLKDRLYTFAPGNRGRRSAQTAIYQIASAIVRLIAPTLVFTSEEVWKHLPGLGSKVESVHMSEFPAAEKLEAAFDKSRAADWERLLTVRQEVLKALEPARAAKTISGALEARATLVATGGLVDLLRKYSAQLPALFIVSQVEVTEGHIDGAALATGLEGLQIRIERAKGAKCERCWNYSTHVGESADYPALCERCVAALAEIDRDAALASGSVKV